MAVNKTTLQTEASKTARLLKIEADGDAWKGIVKPKIRLMGRWLERAGFKPNQHVCVMCIAPGVIELRLTDGPTADQIPSEHSK